MCESNLSYVLPNHSNLGRGLLSMAKMNEWEREHVPCLKTASGRSLYFALVQRWLLRTAPNDMHMKTLAVDMTDRGMRIRIRNFERMGLVTTSLLARDARVRVVHPTQKLLEIFEFHTLAMRKIFRENFLFTVK